MEEHTRQLIKRGLKIAAQVALFLVQLLGAMFLVAGLFTVWLPIPTGIPFIGLGIVLLIYSSERFIGWIREQRERFPKFDRFMTRVQNALPEPMKAKIARTNIVVQEKVRETVHQIIQKHRERKMADEAGLPVIEGEFEEIPEPDRDPGNDTRHDPADESGPVRQENRR